MGNGDFIMSDVAANAFLSLPSGDALKQLSSYAYVCFVLTLCRVTRLVYCRRHRDDEHLKGVAKDDGFVCSGCYYCTYNANNVIIGITVKLATILTVTAAAVATTIAAGGKGGIRQLRRLQQK